MEINMKKKAHYPPSKQPSNLLLDIKIKQLDKELKQIEEKISSRQVNKEEILQIYSVYQTFMNWESAPDFNIDIYTKSNDCNAWVSPRTKDNPVFILHVYHRTKAVCQNHYKALLFHEFTHIFDYTTLDSLFEENRANSIRTWYSEANAVVVSLMCLCGFQNIEENKHVGLGEVIGCCGKEITLDKYFSLMFNEIQMRVDANDYSHIIKPIQYYLGCLMFVKKYCTFSENDFIYLSKTDYLEANFDTNLTTISKIICNYDISPSALKKMLECDENFANTMVHKLMDGTGAALQSAQQ